MEKNMEGMHSQAEKNKNEYIEKEIIKSKYNETKIWEDFKKELSQSCQAK